MKCPNCGQEMIDEKDFCVNCGKRLKKEKKDIKPRTVGIIMAVLILVGVGVCLSIMYLGTGKEIAPFLKDKDKVKDDNMNTNNNTNDNTDNTNDNENNDSGIDLEKANISDIEKYFGNYIIAKVTTNANTSEDIMPYMENIPGWIVEFSDNQIKLGISSLEWITIEKPTFYIDNKDNVKSFFSNNSGTLNILTYGKGSLYDKNESINFVINNNKLYVYRYGALFELVKSTDNYKENPNYYNVSLLGDNYTEAVNSKIDEINKKIVNDIETSYGAIIYVTSKSQNEGTLTHVYIEEIIGIPYSEAVTILNTFVYNNSTGKFLNLEDYLKFKGKTLDSIKSDYDTEGAKITGPYGEDVDKMTLIKDSKYYVSKGTIYIQYANTPNGYVYVGIK